MNLYGSAKLSPQEIRVCDLLMQGYTPKEVAARMFRSPKTVSHHKRKAFRKLGVTTPVQLYRMWLKEKLGEVINP